ncbi:MAG: hypothetical protein UT66_C0036G0028 [candidate division CPR2 bacterium GW2011_GWC1_39_9]|nr:MAG: hypothetical protein UT66_C0036G0028 [candidate division CPR2 bacterium GW2011_GWC1_39_9]
MSSIVKGSKVFETEFAGKKLTIETGNFAKPEILQCKLPAP